MRELIFAIVPFKHFARTYFREFRESAIFLSFCEHKFSRFSRFSDISNILREQIFAIFAEKTIFDILQERAIANFVRYIELHNFLGAQRLLENGSLSKVLLCNGMISSCEIFSNSLSYPIPANGISNANFG